MSDKPEYCHGLMGVLFGHKFDHVYDNKTIYADLKISSDDFRHIQIVNGDFQYPLSKIEKTYVKSVCRRCGREVILKQGDQK